MADKRRVKGVAIHRPIVYGSVATMIPEDERGLNPDHNMRWTVAVRSATSPPPDSESLRERVIEGDIIGGADDLTHFIKKVSFKLHDSYPDPIKTVERPPFEINETGWGEFVVYIKIYFVSESGEKPLQFQHGLKLHNWPPDPIQAPQHQPWLEEDPVYEIEPSGPVEARPRDHQTQAPDPNPDHPAAGVSRQSDQKHQPEQPQQLSITSKVVHSWQYDEVVFTEPYEPFYQTLLSHPPTPLPPTNRFPIECVQQIGPKGESGEFSLDIEEKELKKLNWGKLKILMEIDRLRGKLVRSERQLNEVKRSILQLGS